MFIYFVIYATIVTIIFYVKIGGFGKIKIEQRNILDDCNFSKECGYQNDNEFSEMALRIRNMLGNAIDLNGDRIYPSDTVSYLFDAAHEYSGSAYCLAKFLSTDPVMQFDDNKLSRIKNPDIHEDMTVFELIENIIAVHKT